MALLASYQVGQQPTLTATFRLAPVPPAETGALADPGSVTFVVLNGGIQTVYRYGVDAAVTKVSVGVYQLVYPRLVAADAGAVIHVRANGDTTVLAGNEASFQVEPTAFTTPLP